MHDCTNKNNFLCYLNEKFCRAALIFSMALYRSCQQKQESAKMSPCAPFPLGRERLLENRHSNCAHPRTDSNYRSGLCPSQSTFPQIVQVWSAYIFSLSKTNMGHIQIPNCFAVRTAPARIRGTKREGQFKMLSVDSGQEMLSFWACQRAREALRENVP